MDNQVGVGAAAAGVESALEVAFVVQPEAFREAVIGGHGGIVAAGAGKVGAGGGEKVLASGG